MRGVQEKVVRGRTLGFVEFKEEPVIPLAVALHGNGLMCGGGGLCDASLYYSTVGHR